MAIDFLHAYDAAYKDSSRPENQRLTETGLRGIVAISSGALLLRDDSASPRNIGDLDLVVAGDAAHYDRLNASQALHRTIAALCSAKQWHLHDAMAHYPQKRDRKLIYEMTREFSPADIHEILKNDTKYRLSSSDIAQLQKAAEISTTCSSSLKLDINTDSPKLDSPPHNLANQEVDILKTPGFQGVFTTSPYQMLAAKSLDLNRASRNKPIDLLDFIAALRLLPDKKMTPESAAFMRDCYYKPGTRHRDLINLRQKMDGQPPIPETAMPPLFFTAPTDAIVDRYCKDFEWLYERGVLPNPITRDATRAMINEAYEAMHMLYQAPHLASQPTPRLVFPESVRKAFISYGEKVQEVLKDKSDPYRHFEDLGFALSGRMKVLLEQSAQQTENPTEQAQAKAILQVFSAIKAGKMPPYIVIENLPIDPVVPDPVKEGLDKEDNFSRGSKGPISEYTTVAVSGMCGLYPYVNIEMKDKGFVNQIIPRKSDTKDLAMEKSSRGAGFFDMHTDNCSMQDENVAPFFTLFGLREGKDSIDTTVVLRDEIIKNYHPKSRRSYASLFIILSVVAR